MLRDMEKALHCVEKAGTCEHDHGTHNFVAFEKIFNLTEGCGECVKITDGNTTGPIILQDYFIPVGPYSNNQPLADNTTDLVDITRLELLRASTSSNAASESMCSMSAKLDPLRLCERSSIKDLISMS